MGRTFADLDLDATVRDAVDRAVRLLGATKPPSGRLTVVLDPWVTAQLVGIVAGTLSGEEVIKGRSLFAGRVGETVASPLVTLVEDPTDPRAWGAEHGRRRGPGLAAGAARRRRRAARATSTRPGPPAGPGVASTASAVRGGFKSTPTSGCRAASLAPGTAPAAELLAGVADGVLVQDVSGLHSGVNPVSGDLSTGAQGLRIRNGELAEPLREFTIASTLQRLLHDVTAVGNDVTWLPMDAAGVTLVVADVSISGA